MPRHLYHERYELIESLGYPVEREIYPARVRGASEGTQCLIQRIHPPVTDPVILEKLRELVAIERGKLSRLDSSCGTPKLLDSFEQDRAMYFVYEWIEGISLEAELKKAELENHPLFSIEQLKIFLQESLAILEEVNVKGILHQKITPAQWIYRSSDRKLFLVGLGNIQQFPGTLAPTMLAYDRCFSAPEQLRGHPRANSDLYSLGVIAIQALTGTNPLHFQEDERGKILWESHCQELSPLSEILNRMIEPDIERRYSSPQAALLDLKKLRSALPQTEILSPAKTEIFSSPPPVSPLESVPVPSPTIPDSLPPTVLTTAPTGPLIVTSEPPSPVAAPERPRIEPLPPPASLSFRFSTFVRSRLGKGLGIGVVVIVSFLLIGRLWEMRKQQQIADIVNRIEQLYENGEYEKCIVESNAIETVQAEVPEVVREELASKCILGTAIQQAKLSRYNEALKTAVKIPNASPSYKQAQEHIDQWSSTILEEADRFYRDTGDLEKAIKMIEAIPETSSVKKTALNSLAKWQEDYQRKPGKTVIDLCQVDSVFCSQ